MKKGPYVPKYKGFDEEATQHALDTVDRATAEPHALGEDANAEYMDLGPEEAALRLGWTREELDEAIDTAVHMSLKRR